MNQSDTIYDDINGESSEDIVTLYGNFDSSGCEVVCNMSKDLNEETTVKNALTTAPPLGCPRTEHDDVGDDMSEVSEPPGWSELTREEQLDILDWQMDTYWEEYAFKNAHPVNWWKFTTMIMMMVNVFLLFGLSSP